MEEDKIPADDLLASHAPAKSDARESTAESAPGDGRQLEPELSQDAVVHSVETVGTVGTRTPEGGPAGVTFMQYEGELQLPHIMRLMKADLSEPYSIYTYRYFIHNWPNLCFLVYYRASTCGLVCTCS